MDSYFDYWHRKDTANFSTYRNSWTLESRVGRWTLDAELWTLDSGCWTLDSGRWMLDPGLWMLDFGRWTLEAGLWTLDPGHWTLNVGRWILYAGLWTLDAGFWTLDTVVDCCRTESEPSFWSYLIKLLKILSMRISLDHGHACSGETIGCDVAIFRNSTLTLSVTLFLLWEIELHSEQLSWTVQKQPSIVIYFRKFLQKIPVVESFF